jgi:hypothetical protein
MSAFAAIKTWQDHAFGSAAKECKGVCSLFKHSINGFFKMIAGTAVLVVFCIYVSFCCYKKLARLMARYVQRRAKIVR